jgi:hypothetical protein
MALYGVESRVVFIFKLIQIKIAHRSKNLIQIATKLNVIGCVWIFFPSKLLGLIFKTEPNHVQNYIDNLLSANFNFF